MLRTLSLLVLTAAACGTRPAATSEPTRAPRAPTLASSTLLGTPTPIQRRPIVGLVVDPKGTTVWVAALAADEDDRDMGVQGDPGIHVWDLATGTPRDRIGDAGLHELAGDRDASVIAARDSSGTVVVYGTKDRQERGRVQVGRDTRWIGLAEGAQQLFSVDGRGIASAWDIASGAQLRSVDTQLGEIGAADGTSRGQIAIASRDGRIVLVELGADGGAPKQLASSVGYLLALDLSDDGTRLVVTGEDQGELWDLAASTRQARLRAGGRTARLLADGRVVVSSPRQGSQLQLVDPRTGTTKVLDGWTGHAWALVELPGGKLLAGTVDGAVRTFDLAAGTDRARTRGHTGRIRDLGFTSDGALISSAVASSDSLLWPAARGGEPAHGARALAVSGSGRSVARVTRSPDDAGDSTQISITRGSDTVEVALDEPPTLATLSAQDSHLVLVTRRDDRATISTVTLEGGAVAHWDVADLFVQAVAVSPDGAVIALGGERIVLHDRATGELVTTLLPEAFNVAELAFADAGTLVATTESDGVQVFDVATASVRHALYPGERGKPQGSGDTAYAIAASPDGTLAASGHRGGTIRLWDLTTGREIASASGHRGLVLAAAFSADGKRLATGDQHGQIRVWDLYGP